MFNQYERTGNIIISILHIVMSLNNLNAGNKNWQIYGNALSATSNSNITLTAKDGSGVIVITTSALGVPIGASGERPTTGLVSGLIRFNTSIDTLEVYNTTNNLWVPIASPPVIDTITPTYISDNNVSPSVTDSSINIVGQNFGVLPPSVVLIGSDLTEFSTVTTNITPNTNVSALLPQSVFDNSLLSPFSVRLTSSTSGLSDTVTNALIYNTGPYFISPSAGLQKTWIRNYPIELIPLTLDVSAGDAEGNYPITYSSTDLSANSSGNLDLCANTGVITGYTPALASSSANIPYTVYATDSLGGKTDRTFSLNVYADYGYSIGGAGTYDTSYVESPYFGLGAQSATPTTLGSTLLRFKSGTSTFTPDVDTYFQYLILGGGGGGGRSAGGGGGAGGMLSGVAKFVGGQTYTITVGAGGVAGSGSTYDFPDVAPTNGGNSSITGSSVSLTATGGGLGGSFTSAPVAPSAEFYNGGAGGSGGGGACYEDTLLNGTGGLGTSGQGNRGGGGILSPSAFILGGGGGGAGQPGSSTDSANFISSTAPSQSTAGYGGDGEASYITGVLDYYAGGGSGGGDSRVATSITSRIPGGSGGGGDGGGLSAGIATGLPGQDYKGGGGGGGAYVSGFYSGGAGGAGAVYIRFDTQGPTALDNSYNYLFVTNYTNGAIGVRYVDSGNSVIDEPVADGYTVYAFYTGKNLVDASYEFVPKFDIPDASFLMVGGGGGGGGGYISTLTGGGGGAGGYMNLPASFSANQSYSVQVGGGGTAGAEPTAINDTAAIGGDGGDSSLDTNEGTRTVIGGGGGNGVEISGVYTGRPGGSGGGGKAGTAGGTTGNPGGASLSTGDAIGFAGQNGGTSSPFVGGGGGGAGGTGTFNTAASSGGPGLQNNILGGSAVFYAAGGAGGYVPARNVTTLSTGGSGIGGDGGNIYNRNLIRGRNGQSGTGSGGGGGSADTTDYSSRGGDGGSGIVVIRFPSYAAI